MNIYKSWKDIKDQFGEKQVAVTFGNFDGVHAGHRYLLDNFFNYATKRKLIPLVITFSPHPYAFITNKKRHNIFTDEQNHMALKQIGVDNLFVIDFNEKVQKKKGEHFIQELLQHIPSIKGFFLGHDFSLGAQKEFTSLDLKKQFSDRLEVVTCDVFQNGKDKPSSSKIRQALLKGDISTVNSFLERPYSIVGEVIHGNKIGSSIGFPTANISLNSEIIIPKTGVYFGRVKNKEKTYRAAINIGKRPSVTTDSEVTIETHIIDFEGDLYGKTLELEFISFIRDERKFDSTDELTSAIEKDISVIKKKEFELSFALIGKHIKHSKSPSIYSKLLSGFPINYTLLDYDSEDQISPLKDLLLRYKRVSVTAPYKQFCFENSIPSNPNISSVNTLKLERDNVLSTNTDYIALENLIDKYEVKKYSKIFVLGSGAMAQALQSILKRKNIDFIQLSRRDKNLNEIEKYLDMTKKYTQAFVINCCSREYIFPKVNKSNFVFWDLNYSMPEHVQLFHGLGVRYIDGLELLELQAKNALSFWNLKTS